MSVAVYNKVLTKLFDIAEETVREATELPTQSRPTIQEYRDWVAKTFQVKTDEFLRTLPDVSQAGAPVTFREYGLRNREDIVRRIRGGAHKSVEGAFRSRIAPPLEEVGVKDDDRFMAG